MAFLKRLLLVPRALLGFLLTILTPFFWVVETKSRRKLLTVFVAVAAFIGAMPWMLLQLERILRAVPVLSWQMSAGLAAIGFCLLSMAAVLYVGFRFLASILAVELQVAREFQSANRVFKNYFQQNQQKTQTEGNAIPVDEDMQAQLEEIRKLKDRGLIKDEEVDDFMREAYSGGGDGLPNMPNS